MVTSMFIGLVVLVWFRLLAIFALVLADYSRSAEPTCGGASGFSSPKSQLSCRPIQEARSIGKTLESVREAVDAGASLIVVDDGSYDRTAKIVSEKLRLRSAGAATSAMSAIEEKLRR